MAHLEIKVTNSIGSFDGKITLAANSDAASTDKVMREMIGGFNTMKTLSIENDEGGATVFGEGILRESIITVKAVG